jgi:hypothetical protein
MLEDFVVNGFASRLGIFLRCAPFSIRLCPLCFVVVAAAVISIVGAGMCRARPTETTVHSPRPRFVGDR